MVFREDSNTYTLEVTQLISPEELNSGLWLVIAGIDDIPPHIALISERKYYSVSAKKVDAGTPIENFLKAISRRSVPILFVSIKSPLKGRFRGAEIKSSPQGEDLGGALGAFESYPVLGSGSHSCLWPVRDFFAKTFSDKYIKATLVFELLKMAREDGLILDCKSLFIEPENLSPLGGNKKGVAGVVLPKYTHAQIREKINSILKVNE